MCSEALYPVKQYRFLVHILLTLQTHEEVKPEEQTDPSVTSKQIEGRIFLNKSTCISSVQSILKYLTSKIEVGNRDQMILCCKV